MRVIILTGAGSGDQIGVNPSHVVNFVEPGTKKDQANLNEHTVSVVFMSDGNCVECRETFDQIKKRIEGA